MTELIKSKKVIGYSVSCSRIPQGRFFRTMEEAKREMDRQMKAGARESSIMEVRN